MRFRELYAGRQVCCTCVHYHQHYTRSGKRFIEVYCGHCKGPRLRSRKPSQTCEFWTPAVG